MFEKIALGRTDLVFEFLAQGADATQTGARGMSLLRLCAYHGDPTPFVWRPNAIRFLLERGESLDSLGDNFDLNGAVFHGHWQLVQFFVEQGADVHRALGDTGKLHFMQCFARRIDPYTRTSLRFYCREALTPTQRPTRVCPRVGSCVTAAPGVKHHCIGRPHLQTKQRSTYYLARKLMLKRETRMVTRHWLGQVGTCARPLFYDVCATASTRFIQITTQLMIIGLAGVSLIWGVIADRSSD